jgi:ACR3 family arsenite efflux pump ArsB
MEEFMLPCLNKELFGVDCLGCGAQRAFVMVLKGEFTSAFKLFPAIYPIIILLLFLIVNLFFKFKGDWYVKTGLIILSAIIIIVAYFYKISNLFF